MQVLAFVSMATGVSSVSGFFCTCSADRATRPCVDGRQHRDFCSPHCPSDIAHSAVLVRTAQPEPPSHGFPANSACERSCVRAVGLLPCSASPLQCYGDGHAVHTGELAWFFFPSIICSLHGCSELVRHRFLPDGLFVLV